MCRQWKALLPSISPEIIFSLWAVSPPHFPCLLSLQEHYAEFKFTVALWANKSQQQCPWGVNSTSFRLCVCVCSGGADGAVGGVRWWPVEGGALRAHRRCLQAHHSHLRTAQGLWGKRHSAQGNHYRLTSQHAVHLRLIVFFNKSYLFNYSLVANYLLRQADWLWQGLNWDLVEHKVIQSSF